MIRDGCGDQFGGHRARAVWFVIMEMFRRGYYDEAIVEVLTNRANRISDHIYDQSDPEGYAERQVRQAKEDAEFATHNGVPVKSPGNICIAKVKLSVTVRYDKFADRIMVEGVDGFGPVLDDAAVHRLWLTMDRQLRFRPNLDMLFLVISDVARLNEFHPVCDYLDGLQWDGVKRIDRWLTTYGRAEDTEYTSAVGALVLMAAVRRVRQPGCKFDEMLVLEAPQGKERSTALAILAVRDEWFSDDLPLHVDAQKLIERTRGRWIIECAELSGMKRADIEHIKALLSRQRDRARMVWRKITADAPRQFVPIGTTNSDRYLKDQTGNRRFWPAKTPKFDLDALRRDRDQLWAEAAAREATGASIRLPQHLWEKAEEVQEARLIHDPIYDALHDAIGEFDKGKIAATAIWTILDVRVGAQGQDHNMRVSQAMKNLGWERAPSTIRINGKAVKGYTKGEQPWPQISVERTGPEKFLSVWAGTSTSVTPEENTDLDPRIEVPLYVEEPLPEDERQFLFVPVNLSGEAPLYVEDEGEG